MTAKRVKDNVKKRKIKYLLNIARPGVYTQWLEVCGRPHYQLDH